MTPDLNIPVDEVNALVPVGLVTERVHQLGRNSKKVDASASEASPKKQKMTNIQINAGSAAAARGSPRRAQ